MNDIWLLLIVVAVWFVLQKWLLPRLGISIGILSYSHPVGVPEPDRTF